MDCTCENSMDYNSTDDTDNTEVSDETDTDSEEDQCVSAADSSCNSFNHSIAETKELSYEYEPEQVEDTSDDNKAVFPSENVTSVIQAKSHYANIAFYVIDNNTNKIYGLTNRHVTIHANKTHVKMLNEKNSILLGSPINKEKTNDVGIDVDLIEIDHSIVGHVVNKESKDQQVCIYNDSFDSIFGKEVFKYRPNKGLFELCTSDTPTFGSVASEAEHDEFLMQSRLERKQFLVKCHSGAFSEEGESGTALAIKATKRDAIKLVGIICGGSGRYTVCQFLPTAFEYFKNCYGMIVKIYESDIYRNTTLDNSANSVIDVNISKQTEESIAKHCVPFGIKISFCLTPEQIAPYAFDLVKHALYLMCCKYEDVTANHHELLIEKEHNLSLLVSQRANLLNCSVFENDNPDFVAVEKGILACDFLYNGRPKEAESCLKVALKCIIKKKSQGLRMLCKLTSYITWFCLAANTSASMRQLKTLLKEGIEIFEEDFNNLTGFPTEALGYMHYDFSRYYMNKYDTLRGRTLRLIDSEIKNRQKAVKKAKLSVEVFQNDHKIKNTEETQRRLVLAKCQYAYTILGCGHEFNVMPGEISADDVTQAEDIVNSVRLDVVHTPLVQNVDYLIACIDLKFREGRIQDALEAARSCLKNSEVRKFYIGYNRAKYRVEKLERLRMSGEYN